MQKRMPTNCGDNTCPSCVIAGDFIFLAHHAGGHNEKDVEEQMRACLESMKKTLESAGAEMKDMVQINMYLKFIEDFDKARKVFDEYFDEGNFPARMTTTTDFIDKNRLCMLDGTAYKPGAGK